MPVEYCELAHTPLFQPGIVMGERGAHRYAPHERLPPAPTLCQTTTVSHDPVSGDNGSSGRDGEGKQASRFSPRWWQAVKRRDPLSLLKIRGHPSGNVCLSTVGGGAPLSLQCRFLATALCPLPNLWHIGKDVGEW